MTIKNLLLSGGGINGVVFLGILKKLIKDKYIDLANIETIYGASIGSLIALMLCLKLEFSDIVDYIIKRPWHKVIDKLNFNSDTIFKFFSNKGFLDDTIFKIIMSNLFKAVELDENISFIDLYKYSKINLIISSACLNTFELEEFSHIKSPNMKVIDAVYCSSSIPIIFKPKYINNSFYMDSGLIKNYPDVQILKYCKNEETFGLSLLTVDSIIQINQNDDIFKYFYKVISKLLINFTREDNKVLEKEIRLYLAPTLGNENIWDFFSKEEDRQKLLDIGIKKGEFYLRTLDNRV